jgi:hypothetical protein
LLIYIITTWHLIRNRGVRRRRSTPYIKENHNLGGWQSNMTLAATNIPCYHLLRIDA